MDATKRDLLQRIEDDKASLIEFLRQFIRCRSPNPPGDTREVAAFVSRFLDHQGLPYRIIAPNELMPNIVASFDTGRPGRHLALNGHMDVFPVGDGSGWSVDPWGGELIDGKIYGRGACDMKCGTTASLFTFFYLYEVRERLCGHLTLSAVSDEETFGPWGARYLVTHHPEVLGDCCLNGEPSSRYTVRFGEKGPLWLRFHVRTPGAHGAYTHASPSAVAIAAQTIAELKHLENIVPPPASNLAAALELAADAIEQAYGSGAAAIMQRVTVNPGLINGGLKVNMVAAECTFEVDIRLPNGIDDRTILQEVDRIVAAQPEVAYEKVLYNPPSWCPPDSEMMGYVRSNARAVGGVDPVPVISLGGTDARLWRYADIPAIVYGPAPTGMGSFDEHVMVDDFLHVMRCHVLSAYDYMLRPVEE
jgi:succinyl-diaminopimelate desuccinylase